MREGIKKLPEKKPHLDFIAAILSVPVLTTVLILNIITLQKNAKPTPTPTPSPTPQYYRIGTEHITAAVTPAPTMPTINPDQCTKDIGPINIATPDENAITTDNPVCIGINYEQGKYCASVWAYRINGSKLSDYSNNSVCLYNLPEGTNTFQLFVKSLASGSTKTLDRHFIYKNPASSLTPTASATITPVISPTPAP